MTDRQMWRLGYNAAVQAGLDTNTADAVGHKVAERGREAIDRNQPVPFHLRSRLQVIVAEEVQRHAAP
jgi:hypothetical protein